MIDDARSAGVSDNESPLRENLPPNLLASSGLAGKRQRHESAAGTGANAGPAIACQIAGPNEAVCLVVLVYITGRTRIFSCSLSTFWAAQL